MVKRVVYTIRWRKDVEDWVCRELSMARNKQRPLIAVVADYCRTQWRDADRLSQLRIFGKNGRIQSERTYGRDPKRFPG